MNYSSLSKLKSHINASVVLIFFTLLALVCANTPLVKDWYFSLWQLPERKIPLLDSGSVGANKCKYGKENEYHT